MSFYIGSLTWPQVSAGPVITFKSAAAPVQVQADGFTATTVTLPDDIVAGDTVVAMSAATLINGPFTHSVSHSWTGGGVISSFALGRPDRVNFQPCAVVYWFTATGVEAGGSLAMAIFSDYTPTTSSGLAVVYSGVDTSVTAIAAGSSKTQVADGGWLPETTDIPSGPYSSYQDFLIVECWANSQNELAGSGDPLTSTTGTARTSVCGNTGSGAAAAALIADVAPPPGTTISHHATQGGAEDGWLAVTVWLPANA